MPKKGERTMGLFGLFNKKPKENPADKREKLMGEFAEASLAMAGKIEGSNLPEEDKANAKAHLEILTAYVGKGVQKNEKEGMLLAQWATVLFRNLHDEVEREAPYVLASIADFLEELGEPEIESDYARIFFDALPHAETKGAMEGYIKVKEAELKKLDEQYALGQITVEKFNAIEGARRVEIASAQERLLAASTAVETALMALKARRL